MLCPPLKKGGKMAVKQLVCWLVCCSKHTEWRAFLSTKHLLKENRLIKSSHPLFEGGTADVALDRLVSGDFS